MNEARFFPLTLRFAPFASAVMSLSERLQEQEAVRLRAHVYAIRAQLRQLADTAAEAHPARRRPLAPPPWAQRALVTIEDETWAAATTVLALFDDAGNAEHDVMSLAEELLKACKAVVRPLSHAAAHAR